GVVGTPVAGQPRTLGLELAPGGGQDRSGGHARAPLVGSARCRSPSGAGAPTGLLDTYDCSIRTPGGGGGSPRSCSRVSVTSGWQRHRTPEVLSCWASNHANAVIRWSSY